MYVVGSKVFPLPFFGEGCLMSSTFDSVLAAMVSSIGNGSNIFSSVFDDVWDDDEVENLLNERKISSCSLLEISTQMEAKDL